MWSAVNGTAKRICLDQRTLARGYSTLPNEDDKRGSRQRQDFKWVPDCDDYANEPRTENSRVVMRCMTVAEGDYRDSISHCPNDS